MGDCESTSIHTAAPSHLLSLKKTEDWGVAQLEECLLSICEALSSIPTTQNLGMVAHAYNSSTWEAEASQSLVLGQPDL